MTNQQNTQNNEFYWGLRPSPVLKKFINMVPKGIALDIGAGEGRNSFFLAKNGFYVEALDKNSDGLEKCDNFAKENNLAISTKVCDIEDFEFPENKYSLIIAKNSLDFTKKSELDKLIKKIKKSLILDGFIYLSVFSEKDPAYQKIKKMGLEEVEKNTFYLPKYKTFRHFFALEELKEMFRNFEIIYLEETEIKDPGHGKIPPHVHYTIEFVAKNRQQF